MELYEYCQNMPNIPDVDMAFSDDNLQAYVDGAPVNVVNRPR